MNNVGELLTENVLDELLEKYGNAITCICFMGGDIAPLEVEKLSVYLHNRTNGQIKTGWYSGKKELPFGCSPDHFNYIKLGPYIERFGGLDSPTTNQRFYRIEEKQMVDITDCFYKSARSSMLV